MCLLTVLWRVSDDTPLWVAANRDEWLARPAEPLQLLDKMPLRIAGGRDRRGGGTWLAVNELGLVAGLTNRPLPHGPDLSKRSRGELPLWFAAFDTAESAVLAAKAELDPVAYNPCWLFVADRNALFYVEVGEAPRLGVQRLPSGIHVLENRALEPSSPKTRHVRRAIEACLDGEQAQLVDRLTAVLSSHEVPALQQDAEQPWRPPATHAACVHAGPYGTRSSTVVAVGAQYNRLPRIYASDGPPCSHPMRDRTEVWDSAQ